MNNFKEYDITTLFPGSMRACSMRDAGALWSYSEFDESMGMYFSLLNGRDRYAELSTEDRKYCPRNSVRFSLFSSNFVLTSLNGCWEKRCRFRITS